MQRRWTKQRQALAWIGCFAFSALASEANAEAAKAKTAAAEEKRHAVLVGSSSMHDVFGRIIAADLERMGYRVTRRGVASAGFSRPDFRDMKEFVAGMPIDTNTQAVFVYLGMNDVQGLWLRPSERKGSNNPWIKWSEDGWAEVYERRAKEFVESVCQRGVKRTIVLLPVDVTLPRMQKKLERVRSLQKKAAGSTSCGAAISTSGDVGRFRVNGKSMRRKDGIHMSTQGAQAVWDRIKAEAVRLIDF